MDAVTHVPTPTNETVLDYAPGSAERAALEVALVELAATKHDLPHTIGGARVTGKGPRIEVRQPHAHRKVVGVARGATKTDAAAAVDAANAAAPAWRDLSFDDRAAILLKAADLLAGPWRARINAATMLGQSKTAYQAEIDAACELIDFWRFNVHFARQIMEEQPPANSRGLWNRSDYRSLEGFVYAVTPFNFTAIAGNLPTAPALMGNTVVWKPSHSQQLAAQLTWSCSRRQGCRPASSTWSPATAARCPRSPWRTPSSRACTSPARPRSSRGCGSRSARTSRATGTTRASSARPAARTSSSPTRAPTPTCCAPR